MRSPQRFEKKISHFVLNYQVISKRENWKVCENMWPSHNIWTLTIFSKYSWITTKTTLSSSRYGPRYFTEPTELLMVFKLNEVYISILCPLFAPFNKFCWLQVWVHRPQKSKLLIIELHILHKVFPAQFLRPLLNIASFRWPETVFNTWSYFQLMLVTNKR